MFALESEKFLNLFKRWGFSALFDIVFYHIEYFLLFWSKHSKNRLYMKYIYLYIYCKRNRFSICTFACLCYVPPEFPHSEFPLLHREDSTDTVYFLAAVRQAMFLERDWRLE